MHLAEHQLLVERAAVHADADGLFLIAGHRADRRELLVAVPALADVARVDPVLVQGPGARRVAREQQVAVVVEVADERREAPGVEQALLDLRDGGRRVGPIDRDAHELGPRPRQLEALAGRRRGVGRVGVRHRLDDDRRAASDLDPADLHADGPCRAAGALPLSSDVAPAGSLRRARWRRVLEVIDDRPDQAGDGVVRGHDRGVNAALLGRFGRDRADRRDDGRVQQVGRLLLPVEARERSSRSTRS